MHMFRIGIAISCSRHDHAINIWFAAELVNTLEISRIVAIKACDSDDFKETSTHIGTCE